MAHALHTVLEAADRVRRRPWGRSMHFLFLGDGACRNALKSEAAARGLDNVTFLDSVAKDEVASYWSLLDIAVIHLKKAELFQAVVPSKLFESMAMGIPVLHGVAGESARIVESERVGLVFEPENAGDLCDKLSLLAADPQVRRDLGRNGRRAASRFDRVSLARRMLTIVEGFGPVGDRSRQPESAGKLEIAPRATHSTPASVPPE